MADPRQPYDGRRPRRQQGQGHWPPRPPQPDPLMRLPSTSSDAAADQQAAAFASDYFVPAPSYLGNSPIEEQVPLTAAAYSQAQYLSPSLSSSADPQDAFYGMPTSAPIASAQQAPFMSAAAPRRPPPQWIRNPDGSYTVTGLPPGRFVPYDESLPTYSLDDDDGGGSIGSSVGALAPPKPLQSQSQPQQSQPQLFSPALQTPARTPDEFVLMPPEPAPVAMPIRRSPQIQAGAPVTASPAPAFAPAAPMPAAEQRALAVAAKQKGKQRQQVVPRSKPASSSKVSKQPPSGWTGRAGPMSQSFKAKARAVRQAGACWRCRKYKKPCDDESPCETCLTSGFRVWPSQIGCQRGQLEDMVLLFLPADAEQILRGYEHVKKVPNWRNPINLTEIQNTETALVIASCPSKLQRLLQQVLSTRIFGADFVELFAIIVRFQQGRVEESPLINAACTALFATCDFYHHFISVSGGAQPQTGLMQTVQTLRSATRRSLRLFLTTCLSSRSAEWLPAIAASMLLSCAMIVLSDAAFGVSHFLRIPVWPDLSRTVSTLRDTCYGTLLALLKMLAKDVHPLHVDCWRRGTGGEESEGSGEGLPRSERGMQMVGGDTLYFDSMTALQGWMWRYSSALGLEGRLWSSSVPYSQAGIKPTSILCRYFDPTYA